MRRKNFFRVVALLAAVLCLGLGAQAALAGAGGALQGVKSMDAVFDVRAKAPNALLLQMKLVHAMYKDQAARKVAPSLRFAVVFIGPAVKLVTTSRKGLSSADSKALDQLALTIKAMAKEGIKLELCAFAAKLLKVDLATILPEIEQVDNGWFSLIGYQQQGYALVPIY